MLKHANQFILDEVLCPIVLANIGFDIDKCCSRQLNLADKIEPKTRKPESHFAQH